MRKPVLLAVLLVFGAGMVFQPAFGQYFGRNKVQYEKFDYQIMKTGHFDIYFYPEEQEAVKVAAQMAERWYSRYSRLFNHDLRGRQPLVMYASHPQFEQTTVIPDIMGEGTGGVTESVKRRIILPFGATLEETDHVIGHELVHAFQYDISAGGRAPGAGQQQGGGIERAPLWFVEGMAEYLSIGPVDTNTAMWMRDLVLQKKMPTVKDLRDSNRYFPYRYGQALLAFIGGKWGDLVVAKLMKDVARGLDCEKSLERTLGMSLDKLSQAWHDSLKKDYAPLQKTTQPPTSTGRALVKGTEMDMLNVAPALSPDGKKFVFLSSRDLFSVEMYMSDVRTGKVTRRITKTAVDPHFQSIQFINSAGSWDADGHRFVFAAVSEGKPVLAFLDSDGHKLPDEIKFPKLGEILNPSWSPDGKKIAFSGLSGGYTDLYIYNLETQELKNMTQDPYGDIEPAWSPDGRWIAFVTERFTNDLRAKTANDLFLNMGRYQLALMDPTTGETVPLATFREGQSINPQWEADSRALYFVSDRSGISNIYRIDISTRTISQVTNLYTGVSGITSLSPAFSIASKSNDLLYSVYNDGNYSIFSIEPSNLMAGKPVQDIQGGYNPSVLPPKERQGSEILGLLKTPLFGLPDASKFTVSPYEPKLSLDYVAPPAVGVGVDRFGAYGGGGVAFYWSDMLGYYNLYTEAQVNSRIIDSSFLVAYLNSRNRMNWGLVAQRMPYIWGQYGLYYDVIDNAPAMVEEQDIYRQIFYQVGGFASYPFSQVRRFELSASYNYIQFNYVRYITAYDYYSGYPILDTEYDLPSPPGLHMVTPSAALVYDSAFFGATAPILGQSYRLEVSPTFGTLSYYSLLADYRKYVMPVRPFTLAFRFVHYGRYGKDADDNRLWPMYLGYDTLVRGYNWNSFTAQEVDPTTGSFDENRLFGSKMMVANFELRFPLFGVFGIGRGFYGIFPADFIAFYDVGLAWDTLTKEDKPWFAGGSRKPISSVGIGLRVNVFGYIVAGLNYVKPLSRPDKNWYLQFSIYPGF
jgi:Tol biopolymer transport system component